MVIFATSLSAIAEAATAVAFTGAAIVGAYLVYDLFDRKP